MSESSSSENSSSSTEESIDPFENSPQNNPKHVKTR